MKHMSKTAQVVIPVTIVIVALMVLCTVIYALKQTNQGVNYDTLNSNAKSVEHTKNISLNQKATQIDKNMPPVGKIRNIKQDTHGTAFIIDKHTILTNYHVIKKDDIKHFNFVPKKQPPRFENHQFVPETSTKIIDKHKINGSDLTVLTTDKDLSRFGHIDLSTEKPKPYDKTISYGYPSPKDPKSKIISSEMTKTTYHYLTSKDNQFYVKGVFHPGSSGSPVLNKDGKAYGIAAYRHTDNEDSAISGGYLFTKDVIQDIEKYKK